MRGLLALLLLFLPSALAAQAPIVVSSDTERVSVTIYRDNFRSPHNIVYRWEDGGNNWEDEQALGGFAVIDEVRTVELPPGEVTVRFEGVASGIVPASAILFDGDLKEKNFDARLLSERGLLDAFTGQEVTVRRTDKATGAVATERGTILARPDALILHTAAGYEAVRCDGTFNTMLFPGVPIDLTARPTLSMTTRPDNPGGTVELHLAYLASNFDWEANYVATFAEDGQSLTLTGWMTLASQDRTSFANAQTNAVAGTVFRAAPTEEEEEAAELAREEDPYGEDNIEVRSECFPMGKTSPSNQFRPGYEIESLELFLRQLPQVMLRGGGGFAGDEESIVVTGSRIIRPQTVGDLKFYPLPHRTTVAAQSRKQVQFLDEHQVKGETLYVAHVRDEDVDDGELVFRFTNEEENGLGVPLPLGGIALFQETHLGPQLVGPAAIYDKAVGEDVEVTVSDNDAADYDVFFDLEETKRGKDWTTQKLTVENWNEDYPVLVEVEFEDSDEYAISRLSERTFRRDGARVWRVEVPPDDERTITFRSKRLPQREDYVDY